MLILLMAGSMFTGCKKNEDKPDVIAGFTYAVDDNDYRKVTFTNSSKNYESVSWNFGDNTALSAEINPVHIYQTMATFTVTVTATASDGSKDQYFTDIVINNPDAELTKLVGENSKTWKLIRDGSTGRYPLQVGPASFSTIWWAMGKDNDELAKRPCMLNDEWTFTRDGAMNFDAKGDYWAEGGVFFPANICASTDVMEGLSGEDLTVWGSGNHTYELTSGSLPTLKVVGLGAYIGLCKVGTNAEVTVPQESVTYKIIKLTDAAVDTLILQTIYTTGGDSPQPAYWRFVLVHYDNPADEPPIPGPSPVASFSVEQTGNTISITNTTTLADNYLWDFGDGNTSTAENPVHTYTVEGAFNIILTATNPNGASEAVHFVFVTSTPVTTGLLAGSAWKIRSAEKSIFVGPAMASYGWYSVPLEFMTGGGTGADDWSCIMNDEFIFTASGVYEYKTNGDARNDGYFGGENGCISDADIAASGNGAAFGSGVHTWALTPASGSNRAILTLTNGSNRAAFIGFYKGYYGGENSSNDNPPNGGNLTNQYEVVGYANSGSKEYLFVTVDTSPAHDGSSSWSVVLER